MLMLWLTCLLIGSVTCGPVKQAPRSVPDAAPYYWGGGYVASGPSSAATAPEDADAVPQGYGGQVAAEDQDAAVSLPEEGPYYWGGGYVASVPQVAEDQSPDDDADSAESSEEDAEVPEPEVVYLEPVFSDVSDLQPLYAFSSRSRYQRGREVFSQTSYIPGPPPPPLPVPVYRSSSRPARQRSPPVRAAPKKHGF